jgi:hypothetical protein
MIITGGKYWAAAGNGAPIATSAIPAANRTARAFKDAFLVCDSFATSRPPIEALGAKEFPSEAALTNSFIRVARCTSDRHPREVKSTHRAEEPLSASLPYPALKAEFWGAATKVDPANRYNHSRCMFAM